MIIMMMMMMMMIMMIMIMMLMVVMMIIIISPTPKLCGHMAQKCPPPLPSKIQFFSARIQYNSHDEVHHIEQNDGNVADEIWISEPG